MKFVIVCFIGLLAFVQTGGAQPPVVLGQVCLDDGQPVAEAQVALFDLADLRQGAVVQVTTDETGHFALPLSALVGVFGRPEGFALGQSFPNPFNPSTIIPYQLAVAAHVRLEVFNTLGQHIATLVDGEQEAGMYQAQWGGTNEVGQAVAAGVYLYRLTVGEAHQTGRTVLIDGQAGTPENPRSGVSIDGHQRMSDAGSSAYGLVVSGPALVTYVDSDFGVEAGMGPVDIAVEAQGSGRMKRAQSQGILGDVDNNGRVDIADALLVAMYSANSSISIPNNGDISLGDVDGDGRIELEDAAFIAIYSTNPSDPTLPSGIGRPTGPDHGDTLAEATRINTGSTTVGYIWSRDTDYFRVTVSGSGTLTAHTTSDIDTYGYIYDSSENQLASNDDAGPGGNFQVSAEVSPGTYYIRVRGYSSSTEGSYNLHVNMEGAEGDDHGDSRSEATQITTAKTSGYLSPGDTDYFWVPMSSPAFLRVELTGEEIAISIYDGSGTSPSPGEGLFNPDEIILPDASPDTYYIQVQGVSNSTEGNYTLSVTFSEYIEDEDLLDGRSDSIKKAIHITTGSTNGYYISRENDEDWFWVRVGGSGTLTAYTTTTSGIDTKGSLYDGWGNQLAFDDNTGEDRNFRVSAAVDPGTYYIKVSEVDTTGIGGYTLHVNSMATDDHADSRSDATQITIGSTTVGYISGTSDDDYFRVRVSGSGTLMAYTTSDVDNYGSLYNSSGTELASDDIIRDNPSDRRFRNFQVSAEVNPGTYYIRVRGHGSGRYLLRVMYEPDEEGFNIELVFTDSVTTYERELVRRAAARWMSIITGDLPACDFSENPRTLRLRHQLERLKAFFGADISVPDLSFELNDVVDDLRLYVHTLHINRTTRGYAKQYLQRSNKSTSLPVAGFIVLNKKMIDESNAKTLSGLEMPDKDGMYHTAVHEIGHALGFAWQILYDNGLVSGGHRDMWLFDMINIDVNFTGQRAITAFNNAGGLNYTGDKVPIENNGEYGTQRSHWRYLVFDPRPYIQEDQPQFIRPSELMVGLSHLNRSLSAITIAALADLGYQVDDSQADPYRLPSNRNLGIAKPVAGHSSDHGRENMNCILPGPVHVVDENGRTIRIIGE